MNNEKNEEVRIGVFICHCGGNISDVIDVGKVREEISKIDGVKVCITEEYLCSGPGQEAIIRAVKEEKVNRVVICSCTPRMHLDTFKKTLESAGLNPYLLEITNIREQCSWVHKDKDLATVKAIDLIRGAIERARHLAPLEIRKVPVNTNVLVIGGGIAGIITSIELADKGFKVYLVERGPSIGGHMAQLTETFPTLDCSQCILTPKMVYVAQHPNIEIITMAEVAKINGSAGNYRVLINKKPRYIDISKCVACGECEKICPTKVPSEYEANLLTRKAIYQPFKQAIPHAYVIDSEHCLFLNKGVCRLCEKVCKANAINFDQKEEYLELDVGAIVVCIGFNQINLTTLEEYNYGKHPDIVTNLQFERILARGMRRPSDGKVPKKIAFILCVGSRSRNRENCVQHCCKIGCMVAIKQAIVAKKVVPDAETWIFYADIRADGKGYEEFYIRAAEENVHFVRGLASEVIPKKDGVYVKAEDTLLGIQIEECFDLVVLSPAIIPSSGTNDLAQKLDVQLGPDGFFIERHYKLDPVSSQRRGIFVAGCALGPKDIRETTLEAMAVASNVSTFLGKGELESSPEIAQIMKEKCDDCGICSRVCVASAVERTPSGLEINPLACSGCGICVSECPKGAIELINSTEDQLLAQIKGIAQAGIKPKIIAFLERDTAYSSADMAGLSRTSYSPNIEVIRVPTIGRIGLKQILYAFAMGADAILLVEDQGRLSSERILKEHLDKISKELREHQLHNRLLVVGITVPQYDKLINAFELMKSRIERMGPLPDSLRARIKPI